MITFSTTRHLAAEPESVFAAIQAPERLTAYSGEIRHSFRFKTASQSG